MKITVITVTYNARHTVERTLRSVAEQQLADEIGNYTAAYSQGRRYELEHWVVDGASTDDTIDMVKSFSHVRFVSEHDSGLYDAMNKGMRLATGDYLVFLNAGDMLHDEHTLQHVFDAAQRHPAIIYGQTQWVDDNGDFVDMRNHWAPERLTSWSLRRGMLVCHQSFYVRTDIAKSEPYDMQYHYSADYDWCIRCVRSAERKHLHMHNTHYILTRYLAEGLTTLNHAASLNERMHIMARHYGWIPTLLHHARLVALLYKFTSVALVLITWASLTSYFPEMPMVRDVPFYDKWAHFVMYGALSVAVQCDRWHTIRRGFMRRLSAFFVFPAVWGVLMELAQAHLTTWRSGDPLDALANAVGALLGFGVGHMFYKSGRKQRRKC